MPHMLSTPLPVLSFITAVFIYALWGTPTPNTPQIFPEGIIALCLIMAIGVQGLRGIYMRGRGDIGDHNDNNGILTSAQILLIYGLSAPLLLAFIHGHNLRLVIRDLAPFLFLLLPLFLSSRLHELKAEKYVLYGVLFIGLSFAVRAGLDGVNFAAAALNITPKTELTCLANSPTILFTSIFLIGAALDKFMRAGTLRGLTAGVITTALGGLCLLPMIMTMQRASMGYGVCAGAALIAIYTYTRPRRMIFILGALYIGAAIMHHDIARIIYDAAHKTSLVGFNSRFEELAAVWDRISVSPLSVIFGAGWGASYHSPAVGGLEVNFTHSLLTSMLLKSGLLGAVLCTIYIGAIARRALKHLRGAPVFALASFGALGIPFVLYASYKSLDFGLLLLLFTVYTPKD